MAEYKSAIVSLKNISREFPEMEQKEEVDYLVLESNYLLAKNSIVEKQKERYSNTIKAFEEFEELYTESSRYMKNAKTIKEKSNIALTKINKK